MEFYNMFNRNLFLLLKQPKLCGIPVKVTGQRAKILIFLEHLELIHRV